MNHAERMDAETELVRDKLDDLGYPEAMLDAVNPKNNLQSIPLQSLVAKLLQDIQPFVPNQQFTAGTDVEGGEASLKKFLKLNGYSGATEDDDWIVALDFLVASLQAHRMIATPPKKPAGAVVPRARVLTNSFDRELHLLCELLGVLPPEAEGCVSALTLLHSKVGALVEVNPSIGWSSLLDKTDLTAAQLGTVRDISLSLASDYRLRRQVLLKRLDVTTQSLLWSKRGKEKEKEIRSAISHLLDGAREGKFHGHSFYMLRLFMVNQNILEVQRVTNRGTTCKMNKFVFAAAMPDRGGRPGQSKNRDSVGFSARAPGSEDWTKNGGHGWRGSGRRRGGGGGRGGGRGRRKGGGNQNQRGKRRRR